MQQGLVGNIWALWVIVTFHLKKQTVCTLTPPWMQPLKSKDLRCNLWTFFWSACVLVADPSGTDTRFRYSLNTDWWFKVVEKHFLFSTLFGMILNLTFLLKKIASNQQPEYDQVSQICQGSRKNSFSGALATVPVGAGALVSCTEMAHQGRWSTLPWNRNQIDVHTSIYSSGKIFKDVWRCLRCGKELCCQIFTKHFQCLAGVPHSYWLWDSRWGGKLFLLFNLQIDYSTKIINNHKDSSK